MLLVSYFLMILIAERVLTKSIKLLKIGKSKVIDVPTNKGSLHSFHSEPN